MGLRLLSLLLFLLLLGVLPLEDTRPAGAAARYDHALRLFQNGDLALSQQEAESAVRQYRISDPAWTSRFTLLEADSMLYRGMYEDALRVLTTYRSSGNRDGGAVKKLAIEVVALTRQNRLALAGQRVAEAQTLCDAVDFASCGDVLVAHAILSAKQGRIDQARQVLLHALDFARNHHDPWLEASVTLNLGFIAMQINHYDESLDWSMSAYREAVSSGFENSMQLAAGNLGWAYFQLGDDERALEQYAAAEKIAIQIGNVRSQLKWLADAGYVYRDSGDWSRAAQSYQQALGLARQIGSKEDIANALEDLALVSILSGKLDEADAAISQLKSMESVDSNRPRATLFLTMGELAAARAQYPQAEADFRSAQSDASALMTTKLTAGFQLAQLFEAQNRFSDAEQLYKSTLSIYEAARTQLKNEESQLPFGTNAAQIYDHYIQLLVKQGRSDAALAVADRSRAQTLARRLGDPVTPGSQPALGIALNPQQIVRKTKSTLLFYWLGGKQSYLWTITSAQTRLFTLPPQQQIAESVERYRQALLDLKDPLEQSNPDGQSLYKVLLQPAAPFLSRGSPVIVLADGILSQLNFETLLVPDPTAGTQSSDHLHYLLDDLVISSAPSLAMLAGAGATGASEQKILLIGNPVSADQDFPSLPMFGLEMTRIESHFSSAEVSSFAGLQATPASYFSSDPHRYTYIHFVSHAVASRASPLDSAIILSNPAGREDAYKLYAREIIQHPINARLVTISACYGSGTRAYAGEGLVGLSWAFLHAGAERVIGALWEVSDDSTPLLMDELYRGLTADDSPTVALHNAKLSLLHSKSRFRAPFYWAPFQIYSRQ